MRPASDRAAGVPAVALVLLAVVGTAAGFGLGTGLHPFAWLAWLAPSPALLLVSRDPEVPRRTLFGAAGLGHVLGATGFAHYQVASLATPVAVVAMLTMLEGSLFGLVVLWFRAWYLRAPVLAVLALPVA